MEGGGGLGEDWGGGEEVECRWGEGHGGRIVTGWKGGGRFLERCLSLGLCVSEILRCGVGSGVEWWG